jgi:hypothetical protein
MIIFIFVIILLLFCIGKQINNTNETFQINNKKKCKCVDYIDGTRELRMFDILTYDL